MPDADSFCSSCLLGGLLNSHWTGCSVPITPTDLYLVIFSSQVNPKIGCVISALEICPQGCGGAWSYLRGRGPILNDSCLAIHSFKSTDNEYPCRAFYDLYEHRFHLWLIRTFYASMYNNVCRLLTKSCWKNSSPFDPCKVDPNHGWFRESCAASIHWWIWSSLVKLMIPE
jgi:hypothetical protein